MDIKDQVWAMLTCKKGGKKGGKKESHAANNKSLSFPNWGNFSPFKHFDLVSTDGSAREPVVTSATCLSCKERASIETQHGFDRPEGF